MNFLISQNIHIRIRKFSKLKISEILIFRKFCSGQTMDSAKRGIYGALTPIFLFLPLMVFPFVSRFLIGCWFFITGFIMNFSLEHPANRKLALAFQVRFLNFLEISINFIFESSQVVIMYSYVTDNGLTWSFLLWTSLLPIFAAMCAVIAVLTPPNWECAGFYAIFFGEIIFLK